MRSTNTPFVVLGILLVHLLVAEGLSITSMTLSRTVFEAGSIQRLTKPTVMTNPPTATVSCNHARVNDAIRNGIVVDLSVTCTATNGTHSAVQRQLVEVVDTTPPELVLLGNSPLVLQLRNPVHTLDPGYITSDMNSGRVVVSSNWSSVVDAIGLSLTNTTQTVVYQATDAVGHVTTARRTVQVIDHMAPQVQLVGLSTIVITQGDLVADPGIFAHDNVTPQDRLNITTSVSFPFLATALGSIQVHYTVTDLAGLQSSVSRTINVQEPAPMLTLTQRIVFVEGNATAPTINTTTLLRDIVTVEHGVVSFTPDTLVPIARQALDSRPISIRATSASGTRVVEDTVEVVLRDTRAPRIHWALSDSLVEDTTALPSITIPFGTSLSQVSEQLMLNVVGVDDNFGTISSSIGISPMDSLSINTQLVRYTLVDGAGLHATPVLRNVLVPYPASPNKYHLASMQTTLSTLELASATSQIRLELTSLTPLQYAVAFSVVAAADPSGGTHKVTFGVFDSGFGEWLSGAEIENVAQQASRTSAPASEDDLIMLAMIGGAFLFGIIIIVLVVTCGRTCCRPKHKHAGNSMKLPSPDQLSMEQIDHSAAKSGTTRIGQMYSGAALSLGSFAQDETTAPTYIASNGSDENPALYSAVSSHHMAQPTYATPESQQQQQQVLYASPLDSGGPASIVLPRSQGVQQVQSQQDTGPLYSAPSDAAAPSVTAHMLYATPEQQGAQDAIYANAGAEVPTSMDLPRQHGASFSFTT
eukprot:m.13721 g.13721  ORF g.13721 m.13721 type:complete len:757 (-) comp5987_c0_seq1:272-2542(-)